MLRKFFTAVALIVGLMLATVSPAVAAPIGNDYPWPGNRSSYEPDPWNMSKGQCTSFAAWRLSQDGHPILGAGRSGWNASKWDDNLAARGHQVDQTPHVGDIGQWESGETTWYWNKGRLRSWQAGKAGHVGYVAAVYGDGTILFEDVNGRYPLGTYHRFRISEHFVGDFIRTAP